GVEVSAVELADNLAHVLPLVIPRPRERVRLGRRVDLDRGRLAGRALVHEDLRAGGVVYDREPVAVEVVRLPQLGRDAQVVEASARDELVAAHLDPLLGLPDLQRLVVVDAQPDGRAPGRAVFDEAHTLPVEGEERRARALQTLFGED